MENRPDHWTNPDYVGPQPALMNDVTPSLTELFHHLATLPVPSPPLDYYTQFPVTSVALPPQFPAALPHYYPPPQHDDLVCVVLADYDLPLSFLDGINFNCPTLAAVLAYACASSSLLNRIRVLTSPAARTKTLYGMALGFLFTAVNLDLSCFEH